MPETTNPNKRRTRQDDVEQADASGDSPASRKRRAFLQTMGQQLREYGPQTSSPRDYNRGSFGTSPHNQGGPPTVGSSHISSGTRPLLDTPESDAAPGEADAMSGNTHNASKWLWRPQEIIPSTGPSSPAHCTFQDLLDWSQNYFDHWHPAFPFLHAPSILDYFRQVVETEITTLPSTQDLHYTMLRAIISISLMDARQKPGRLKPVPSMFVFQSHMDAIDSVRRTLIEETSILSLQTLVSVQVFLISMLRYNAASRLEGVAVRMVFQLRLHHCPARIGGDAATEAELRKRLFWSIFCIDRYICIRLGIPLGIRFEDVDVCYPHSEKHGTRNADEERDSRLDLLDFLARHAETRGSIMELRNRAALDSNITESETIMRIEAEHTKWWNYIDEYLSDHDPAPAIAQPHRITLVVLRFELVIALHRSVLATSTRNSAYNVALQRCISASRSIINTLHKARQDVGNESSSQSAPAQTSPLMWPSFTWALWMSAFIIIFAATEDQMPREVATKLANRSIEVLKHLALRGTNWPEACIVAIRNLIARLEDPSRGSSQNSVAGHSTTHQGSSMGTESGARNRFSTSQMRINNTFSSSSMAVATNRVSAGAAQAIPQPPPNHNLDLSFSDIPYTTNLPPVSFVAPHLASSGNFLGIAQQLSDNPISNHDIMTLFNGEDMGYIMGNDLGFGD
ncbi:hypothetical protein DM02DRAFT_660242 [Periconia macrospinosa]|uniref:Xylanolytic transcriptional activator regulatory domain-containing protein n=1 Tax=Periconia macrospinosa TaxID=97972 RepID=A0A2V1DB39_9PLEO|nr:hypothetical protein DM02DRAFT_660242 [Periconia macrospinosa]